MTRQGLGRFLPERSQLMLLVGLFVILFAAAGFINLAVTKSEALASLRSAQQQRDQLLERKQALSKALGDAQGGYHIPKMALWFFRLVSPGVTVVTATEVDVSEEETGPTAPVGPPYWGQWLNRLWQP